MTAYFSSCPTRVNSEGEECKAVVTVLWFASLVLQRQPLRVKRGHRFHFDSHRSHGSVGVTRYGKTVKEQPQCPICTTPAYRNYTVTALLVVVKGKLQARERSTKFQLAMGLYRSTSTLAVIELEVNRYEGFKAQDKIKKKKETFCK